MSDEIFLRPVKSENISKIIMERIKNALISKSLKPGDRLPTESQICDSMNVGKSSVREAIKMLEVLGVVETKQGNGTYISCSIPDNSLNPLVYQMLIDFGNNSDIFELRSMFEPAYTLLAMKKATDEDIEHIVSVFKSFEEKVNANTQQADDDLAFHRAILNATHNPFIIRIGLTILQLFYASISKSMQNIPQQAVRDHALILDAFLSKDEAALHKAVLMSLEGWNSMMNLN